MGLLPDSSARACRYEKLNLLVKSLQRFSVFFCSSSGSREDRALLQSTSLNTVFYRFILLPYSYGRSFAFCVTSSAGEASQRQQAICTPLSCLCTTKGRLIIFFPGPTRFWRVTVFHPWGLIVSISAAFLFKRFFQTKKIMTSRGKLGR